MKRWIALWALILAITAETTVAQSGGSGTISGRLRRPDNSSVEGIRVAAIAAPEAARGAAIEGASTLVGIAQTDSAGRFRLENVPAGRYLVIAGPLCRPAYYPGVATADAAKALTVSAGSALDQIDFVVPPNTVQTGNVAAAYAVTQSFDHSRFVQIQGVVTKTPLPDGQYSAPPVLIPLIAHINVKDVSGAITDWAVFSGNGTSCPLRLGDQIEFSGFQAKNGGPQVFVEREIRIK